ncbi:glycoside hydrolase family 61 protein [Pholiota conissans]|uniref:AA9 family lytic polysaccharide monooxygenase n=1 Tax=Pholiota conissans TaxID=109636 RepID=A0A9P5Z3L9_9AGAR|nr:glycoside hydrolase family 61 protein [Pholiota conissans]
MQLGKLALLASFVSAATAHTRIWSIWVNGVDQGTGLNTYIRSPPNNNPVKDLTSSAVACNVNNVAVPQTIQVKAGDKVTFEWFHDTRGDDIIASSHKGPIVVYIAPTSSNGAGSVWTKIFHAGYTNGAWAVDNLLTARGKHNIIVPNLPAGDYLLRAEILALHEANVAYASNPVRGIQLYMNCVQIRITSSGTQSLPSGSTFPGLYTPSTPGIVWNIYDTTLDQSTYPIPGPAVWSGAAGGSITA